MDISCQVKIIRLQSFDLERLGKQEAIGAENIDLVAKLQQIKRFQAAQFN